uniref:filamin-C n=1 Tax=Maylandia zebra TaxID=106582 RepID=UPI000D30CB83|nr:filamin-C-like [Maylandia zebra]
MRVRISKESHLMKMNSSPDQSPEGCKVQLSLMVTLLVPQTPWSCCTPSQVKVLPTHDTSKVRASGSGLNTTGAPTSLPVKVTIDAKDAGPRGEAQEADICDSHDGTYLVFYVPDMTDRYTTLIKYGGDKIPYSPY